MENREENLASVLNRKDESHRKVDKLIFICYHLSVLQCNLFKEVEQILDSNSEMKHNVKHNHNRIAQLLKGQYKTLADKWKDAPQENLDLFVETSEELEKDVRSWFGIK